MDVKLIKARRKAIQADACCDGCGSTLASCKANRGRDKTAPRWFGCCARGLDMGPCNHVVSSAALIDLLREVESGHVRSLDEMLLDSVSPVSSRQRRAMAQMLATRTDPDTDYYGE